MSRCVLPQPGLFVQRCTRSVTLCFPGTDADTQRLGGGALTTEPIDRLIGQSDRSEQVIDIAAAASPTVTIVVPARNEQESIAACLETILRQSFTDFELIVVDGASTDATAAVVTAMAVEDSRIRLFHNPARVIPRSLNIALAAARGRWLVRVDAHAQIPVDYVRRAVEHLSTGRYGGVGGRKDGVGRTSAGKAVAAAMSSRFGVGNSSYHYGERLQNVEHIPFGAYPVELARRVGGWDERLSVNQDFEFDYRVRLAGYDLLFDPELVIDWECRQSISALFAQYKRYGRGKVAVGLLHPASVRIRHLMAPALVASWLAAATAARRRPLLSTALTAPYAVAVAVASCTTARRLEDKTSRPLVAPAFLAMHAGWGLGFWSGVGRAVARLGRPPQAPATLADGASTGDPDCRHQ
jgi:cellulose synthase/poly-beta-1,6-N-acetylglucosamine synthase-like glycosyltransferase